MATAAVTFLMFDGVAEEAMNFYASLFQNAAIRSLERYAPGEGPEGTVKKGLLEIAGHNLRFFDSPMKHEFSFTPAISIFVECENETELTEAFNQLADGGNVAMPLDNYGFSKKFGWVNDRFGVSWQLNLE
jgi:predicted 3-demethylubiquinone-9 3-methyltransferase (glyoxalase superfamily)